MKKILFILVLIYSHPLAAQTIRVADVLRQLEMENISVAQRQDTITAAFEPSAYRGVYPGIATAICHLVKIPEVHTLQLIILDNDLPQLCITLDAGQIQKYQQRMCTMEDIYRTMEMTASTSEAMRALKGTHSRYSSFGQTDLVLYPGIMLVNNDLNRLYRVAVDIQPALEMQLWKGASLRAQACLPLINNEIGKWDCIRPGYLTIRQAFRFGRHWQGYVAGGNFSNDRQGIAASFCYFSADGRLTVGAEGGVTGISHLYSSNWWLGKWKRTNAMLTAGYYIPRCNTQVKVEGGRFLYGDDGVKGTLSRYFGEYIVGVYAMYTDGEKNAGFHFSIPLPGKKRSRRKGMRVMLPENFSFQFDMRGGNEYARRRLGEGYRTEPKAAQDARFYQPDYIRYFLIKTNKQETL